MRDALRQKLFQKRPAEERFLNAAQDSRPPPEPSAPQGLDMSSRGNAPGNVAPLTAFPSPRLRGEGCRRRGVGSGLWALRETSARNLALSILKAVRDSSLRSE